MLRRYLLAGLPACGLCGRRMESAWSNGRAAYRCRHGQTSAMAPDPARPKNTYVRGQADANRLGQVCSSKYSDSTHTAPRMGRPSANPVRWTLNLRSR